GRRAHGRGGPLPGPRPGARRVSRGRASSRLRRGLDDGHRRERGGDATADFALAAAGSLTGRLIGSADRPVAGRVEVSEVDGQAPPGAIAPTLAADAGPDGRFRIEKAPPGAYVLAATAPGHGPRRVEAVVGGPRVTDVGDVTLESGLVMRGHVRESSGLPVAEARLSLSRMGGSVNERGEGRTQADGSFAIGGLTAGGYWLQVSAPG